MPDGTPPSWQEKSWEDGAAPVHVQVPATADHIGLVRLLASGLASRAGFGLDAVDDLRLAVDELCFAAAAAAPAGTILDVEFTSTGDGVSVRGRAILPDGATDPGPPARSGLADRILDNLTAEHEVSGRTFRARIASRRA